MEWPVNEIYNGSSDNCPRYLGVVEHCATFNLPTVHKVGHTKGVFIGLMALEINLVNGQLSGNDEMLVYIKARGNAAHPLVLSVCDAPRTEITATLPPSSRKAASKENAFSDSIRMTHEEGVSLLNRHTQILIKLLRMRCEVTSQLDPRGCMATTI